MNNGQHGHRSCKNGHGSMGMSVVVLKRLKAELVDKSRFGVVRSSLCAVQLSFFYTIVICGDFTLHPVTKDAVKINR